MDNKQNEGYHISHFEKGDLVIRCKSVIKRKTMFNENLGVAIQIVDQTDNSYRHAPLRLKAIENGVIYLQHPCPSNAWDKEYVTKLLVDEFGDNWMPFILPEGLTIEQCCR